MNYRHIYHAGNFADVVKHVILLMLLDYLGKKDKGLFLLDAFAGAGCYALRSPQALKTGESLDGAARIMSSSPHHPDLARYRDRIAPYWGQNLYPGSPLLLAESLRLQDRLVANELHPEDAVSLARTLSPFPQARVLVQDAYETVRSLIPPQERRGLVLVDPPFENKDEFSLLGRQAREWKKRWATGCFALWYPLKQNLPVSALHTAMTELDIHRTWVAEFDRHAEGESEKDGLAGCGLVILNTPFGIPERFRELAPELVSLLGYGRVRTRLLTGE